MVDSILNAPWWPWSRTKVTSTARAPVAYTPARSTSSINSIISTASTDDYDYDWGTAPSFPSISVNLTGNAISSDKFNVSLGTTFDNYTTGFIINDTTDFATGATDGDYNWWNCTSCQFFLDTASTNNSSINHTRMQFDDDNESTIYLIQVVLTAIILGVVILATVIGKSLHQLLLLLIFSSTNLTLTKKANIKTSFARIN